MLGLLIIIHVEGQRYLAPGLYTIQWASADVGEYLSPVLNFVSCVKEPYAWKLNYLRNSSAEFYITRNQVNMTWLPSVLRPTYWRLYMTKHLDEDSLWTAKPIGRNLSKFQLEAATRSHAYLGRYQSQVRMRYSPSTWKIRPFPVHDVPKKSDPATAH